MVRACFLLVFAGCSSGGLKWEERREWRGATTRLTLLDPAPVLGAPLRFRVELFNGGAEPLVHRAHGAGFDILGPDGEELRWIGWVASTFSTNEDLAPGARSVLDEVDVSTHYLFERPGRYRARFSGGGLTFPKPDEEWPGWHTVLLVSDWVEFTIGEGKVAPVVDVIRRLRPIIPPDWFLSTSSGETSMTVRLIRTFERKGDEIWLQLGGRPDAGFTRLGEGPWGPVWLRDRDSMEAELRTSLLDALRRP